MSQQERYIEDFMIENPNLAKIIYDYKKHLRSQKSSSFQNLVYQRDRYRDSEESNSDAYQDLWFLGQKNIYLLAIPTEESPLSDKDKIGNNEILEKLSYPFEAHFEGGCGDFDGIFKWKESIYAFNYYEERVNKKWEKLLLKPGSCSLEVGYTKGVTTKLHLSQSRFLARWPYEHKYIWLIYWDNHEKLFNF